jgi:hypothetical protein
MREPCSKDRRVEPPISSMAGQTRQVIVGDPVHNGFYEG